MENVEKILPALQQLQADIFEGNKARGWWENRDISNVDTNLGLLMLICSEAAEGCEEVRKGMPMFYTLPNIMNSAGQPLQQFNEEPLRAPADQKPEGLGSELADIVIRCFDMAGGHNFDLGAAILAKLRYNATRAHRHGGKLA